MKKLNLILVSLVLAPAVLAQNSELNGLPGGSPKVPRSISEVNAARPQPAAKPSCVKGVTKTITVGSNQTLDGKGCLYSWRGAGYPSKCRASKELSEKEPPMFKLQPGATLKNLQMECALDGIHTTRNNKIQNIINRDVEEDAITIGTNITIENSEFWFCQDKCLQMNSASTVTIRNNKFYHATSPMKANTGRSVRVEGNQFYNVNRAIRSAGSVSSIYAKNNVAKRGLCFLAAEDKGLIVDEGGNTGSVISKKHCTERGGKISVK